jgi:predicted PurR-regulated permease PerM
VDLWKRVEVKVGLWLQGQLLLALVVGLMVFIGLALLDVKFALVFALLAMALEIVPVAGPVLAAIPAILLAFVLLGVPVATIIVEILDDMARLKTSRKAA